MVIRNNAIGSSEISASAVSKEYQIQLQAGGDTVRTECLNVQGLPRIAIQIESRDNTTQVVEITLQGGIAQEGADVRYFNLNPQLSLVMSSGNYVFSNYDMALQYVRIQAETSSGLQARIYVRITASQ
tara:strand:+ start:350 stop:733 length:384 start_codon:yes stop_codon:yes gene_type:complete